MTCHRCKKSLHHTGAVSRSVFSFTGQRIDVQSGHYNHGGFVRDTRGMWHGNVLNKDQCTHCKASL